MIRYQELDPIQAKGKRDPVAAWLALAPTGAPAERPATTAPLVGRSRELTLLDSVWDRGRRAAPHLVTLVGPMGIGKSRMTAEVRARAEAAGARTFVGRCLPYGQTGYRPFTEQIPRGGRDLRIGRSGGGHGQAARADRGPRRLPRGGGDHEARRRVDRPRRERRADGRAAAAVLRGAPHRGAARERAADGVRLRGHPLGRPPAARPPRIPGHARPRRPHAVPRVGAIGAPRGPTGLGQRDPRPHRDPVGAAVPLDSASIASYLLSGSGDLTPVERLVEVAEGNPLFIEELAASLLDRGPSDELPTTVRAAIASRIDALPAGSRAALLAASVVGKHFWRGVLHSFDDLEGVDEALSALEARDLIRREPVSQVQGDAEFAFKHILIREVAYSTLARAERRRRHADVARFIEGAVDRADPEPRVGPRAPLARGGRAGALTPLPDRGGGARRRAARVPPRGGAVRIRDRADGRGRSRRQDLTVKRLVSFTRLSHAVYDAGPVRWEPDDEQP